MLEVLKAQVSQLEREAKSIFRREQVGRVARLGNLLLLLSISFFGGLQL